MPEELRGDQQQEGIGENPQESLENSLLGERQYQLERELEEGSLNVTFAGTISPQGEIKQWGGEVPDEKDRMTYSYSMNNSILAFMDKYGKTFIAPASLSRVQKLEEYGYKASEPGFNFPLLSNGEQLDGSERIEWESILMEEERKRKEESSSKGARLPKPPRPRYPKSNK